MTPRRLATAAKLERAVIVRMKRLAATVWLWAPLSEERAHRYRAAAERIRRKAASILTSQSDRHQLLEIAEQHDLMAATERSGFPFG